MQVYATCNQALVFAPYSVGVLSDTLMVRANKCWNLRVLNPHTLGGAYPAWPKESPRGAPESKINEKTSGSIRLFNITLFVFYRSGGPKGPQRAPQRTQREPQASQKEPPETSKVTPGTLQGPLGVPRTPRGGQRGPQGFLRSPKGPPGGARGDPPGTPRSPKGPQGGPGGASSVKRE